MSERESVNVDRVHSGLNQALERINAGPAILRYKSGLFGGMGKIVPPDLRLDGDKGEVRLEYSLVYPPPREGKVPDIIISIGVSRSIETSEDLAYIDSDGQRIFQASPNDEEIEQGINDALRDDFVRRLESGTLPVHVRGNVYEVVKR